MARTVSYGMGQYRFTKNYNYITKLDIGDPAYCDLGNDQTGLYKDVLVKLPTTDASQGNVPAVQYGQTYFLKLTVPQNRQYTITLNLKLCPAATNNTVEYNRFQQIGRIEVPPIPNSGNIYSEVVLFETPDSEKITKVGLIDAEHDRIEALNPWPSNNELYKYTSSGIPSYIYNGEEVINYNSTKMTKTWEVVEGLENQVTYRLAFSPKYNLAEGYRYLLIETDRNNLWTNDIQYIDENKTYNGTYLDKNAVKVELYGVSNLLAGASEGYSQIKSGTSTLNHIAVWGHPEQIITINGEEIRIGSSNFYEIKDYEITSLGVVVEDPDVDRFTIDYEYKITS